ncbi:MAG TPA: sigma-70 family RNA polymerase sigma factor [Terriglobales bacterium]|nr:sigma-70 family RNA polymerase sigma factor [Terriglobales bacterium]
MHTFDSDYLYRLKTRDSETEGHFAAYFSRLITIKLRMLGLSGGALEDTRQETLLRVLKGVRAGTVQQPERFSSYVYAVCNHVVSEWKRAEWPARHEQEDEALEFVDPAARPEDKIREEEIRKTVYWLLDRVSRRDRSILLAVFMHERDKDEICREFNVSREYLRVLLHRALLNAKKKLGDAGSKWIQKGAL